MIPTKIRSRTVGRSLNITKDRIKFEARIPKLSADATS